MRLQFFWIVRKTDIIVDTICAEGMLTGLLQVDDDPNVQTIFHSKKD